MKAVVCTSFGRPDGLRLKEVAKPIPKENEILVKVYATSLNASDWEFLSGKPLYARLFRLFNRTMRILGSDIAGRVEQVGKDVTLFQPGDRVFGDIFERMGGLAEYVCGYERNLALIPDGMSYEEAAAVPQAAVIALQGIYSDGQVTAGERVLVNGAGGGVGTFAVQLAKLFGAKVTGVDSGRKLELLRSLGADFVIDYQKEDFTKNGRQYDLILDLSAHHSIADYKRALSENGRCLVVGGSTLAIVKALLADMFNLMGGNKRMALLAWESNKDLAYLKELFEEGKLAPVIDKRFGFDAVPEAFDYLGRKQARGKIVINIIERNEKTL